MRWLSVIVSVALVLMAILYAITFWSMHQIEERIYCYRHSAHPKDCAPPSEMELRVRWLIDLLTPPSERIKR